MDPPNENMFEALDTSLREWHSTAPQYSDMDPYQVNDMLIQAHALIYA